MSARLRRRPDDGSASPSTEDRPRDETTGGTLSMDDTFTILRNQRRRTTLRVLREHGPELTQGELAERVAAVENDVEREQVTSSQRKRVYISLHQNHLPLLAESGVVDYDSNRGTVDLCGAADQLFAYLDEVDALREDPADGALATPSERAVLAAATGGNLLVAVVVALGPAPEALTVVAAVCLFALALFFRRHDSGDRR